MSNINERVKQLRSELGLSGEKFGARLGVGRSAISDIERCRNGLSEQNIKSICREFNVNENWLRTGEGEMFNPIDSLSLDDLSSDLTPLEMDILKAYFTLDKDIREKALNHFVESLKND